MQYCVKFYNRNRTTKPKRREPLQKRVGSGVKGMSFRPPCFPPTIHIIAGSAINQLAIKALLGTSLCGPMVSFVVQFSRLHAEKVYYS